MKKPFLGFQRATWVFAVALLLLPALGISTAQAATIFNSINTSGVSNGPSAPTVFSVSSSVKITNVSTYHWNGGGGSTPGTITLKHSDGTVYGPWTATGHPDPKYFKLYWNVYPDEVIKAGTYTVIDSDTATWSYNSASGNAGFVLVQGDVVTVTTYTISATASPTAGGSVTCSPNPVSSGSSSTCTATANSGYTFANWSGDCSGATSACTLSNVAAQKSVTAVFNVQASSTAANMVWSAAAKIDSFAAETMAGSAPKIAVDPSGNIMAVWVQSDGTYSNIYANRYVAGAGWGTATLLETSTMDADSPQIAVDANGNFMAVWRQAWKMVNGTRYGIYASRYVAGTGWDTAAVVYADTKREDVSANAPQIAVDPNGNAMAVWSMYDWSWNHTSVRANRYVVGTGWSGAVNLSGESVQIASSPKVAVDAAGNAMVVWSQDADGNKSVAGIHADRYTVGTGWGAPTLIGPSSSQFDGYSPQIAFDPNGNAIAVWYDYSKPGIRANRYVAGTGWGTAQTIADKGTTSYDEGVRLAVDKNGNAIAVWNQTGGVLYANRYVAGTGWGATEIIDSVGSNSSAQVAFDPSGNAIAIWGKSTCNSSNIMAKRYVAGTGWDDVVKNCWTAASFVNSAADRNREPQIVIDKNGNATAVWVRGYGGYGSIYASSATVSSPTTTTTPTTSSDCIFNWAEKNYAELFSPAGATSKNLGEYYYRYYSGKDAYLATSSKDSHLYYLGPFSGNKVLDVGAMSQWLTTAGCK